MITLRLGDCRDLILGLPPGSVDAIVTDPPYELGFMGKGWDKTGIANDVALWRACLGVLKPGAHLVAFSSTRTSHRMVSAIEDAGFDIRDTIHWCYWSGFPKSLDISKEIDRLQGDPGRTHYDAHRWAGYGTAIKPAIEPCVLARKPIAESSIARQVLATGTGALNVDGCRFAPGDPMWPGPDDGLPGETFRKGGTQASGSGSVNGVAYGYREPSNGGGHTLGRFPANLIHVAKASRSEREAGCEGLPTMAGHEAVDRTEGSAGVNNPRAGAGRTADAVRNGHPTVKPIRLMRWLCRLVGGQRGSVILDPFMGSGTTGIAAGAEGFGFIGFEKESDYLRIAAARIRHYSTTGIELPEGVDLPEPEQIGMFR